ncbi:DNA primase [Paenibacillus anaericanus]|uniref:DNA primase n=1 Tax=Paenibacillus anaericanus TaxID=170367 RepID=A0A3S1KC91_9BACL|nr:toprim domain-containing protein [Paenibacillus anaericanus]RUT48721.1 DNA primase [Paenibacillus anaericanus]
MPIYIIVEGKNDRIKLSHLLQEDEVNILCTFGTLNATKFETLQEQVGEDEVLLFLDNDTSGRRIRGILREVFPDAIHMYTRKGYAGVEGTPDEYIIAQLEKAGLEAYILYPPPDLI